MSSPDQAASRNPGALAAQIVESFHRSMRISGGIAENAGSPPAPAAADPRQYAALAAAVRDAMIQHESSRLSLPLPTEGAESPIPYAISHVISADFAPGRLLDRSLRYLGVRDEVAARLSRDGIDLAALCDLEPCPDLGGLDAGLHACELLTKAREPDDESTQPRCAGRAVGHGIRYELGTFEQGMVGGWQVERPSPWMRDGFPWEIARPDQAVTVRLYGFVDDQYDSTGRYRPQWVGTRSIVGIPHDVLLPRDDGADQPMLRLWSARAGDSYDAAALSRGGLAEAVRERALVETLTHVACGHESTDLAREARLVQQYFLCACAMADLYRALFARRGRPEVAELAAGPTALCVAELMRLLLDERGVDWEDAWAITTGLLWFSPHSLMTDAAETWRISLFSAILPRHLQIIYEINRRWLLEVAERWPDQPIRWARASLIQESPVRAVRPAMLALVGCRSSQLSSAGRAFVKHTYCPEWAALRSVQILAEEPSLDRRRWLDPGTIPLADWCAARDANHVDSSRSASRQELAARAVTADGLRSFRAAKNACKQAVIRSISEICPVPIPTDPLWSLNVACMSDAGRPLMTALAALAFYQSILDQSPTADPPAARVMLIAGRAVPDDRRAKLSLKFICDAADRINRDERARDRLRLVFLPDFDAVLAQRILSALDLFERTASPAAGEHDRSLAAAANLCGALRLGPSSAANPATKDEADPSDFPFGPVPSRRGGGRATHDPWKLYSSSPALQKLLGWLAGGELSPDAPGRYRELFDGLTRGGDPTFLLADLDSYLAAHRLAGEKWKSPFEWDRAAILAMARSGTETIADVECSD